VSTWNDMHTDAASEPTLSGEPVPGEELGIRVVSADEMEPASVITDIPDADAPRPDVEPADELPPDVEPADELTPDVELADASASQTRADDDRRWQEILGRFVDDPRGCVQAATELVEDELSTFAALMSRRRESMDNSTSGESDAKTEQMRQAVMTYRDISRQLAASTRVVS
jgi:hypothetical protein